ncbi:MAG TPA: hypothetical protein VMT53_23540 [Terriglobales bacterium]|nr:hypothetical protein [Terriglobales bacterium]
MLSRQTITRAALMVSLLGLLTGFCAAQALNSSARAIALNADLSESVSVNLSASAVNFNLSAGSANNPGSTGVTATTSWKVRPGRFFLRVYAFFASSTAALTDSVGDNIPSSAFQISDNGGAFQALTNATPFGGANAGLRLGTTFLLFSGLQGKRTDAMNFNINLTSVPQLPAGNYTGTVTVQVQVI